MKNLPGGGRLIKDIKKLIEDYTSSVIDVAEAEDAFKALSGKYEKLRTGHLNRGDTDILKSLCYQHNCTNFSIFTGIFMVFDDRILKLNYAGSSSIASKISKVIESMEKSVHEKIETVELNSDRYYTVRFMHNGEELIIVSQSTSSYFSHDRFRQFFLLLKSVLPRENKSTDDLFTHYDRIMTYIEKTCNEDRMLCCYIYSFPELNYIFGHMGDDFLINTDGKLMKIMEHDFPGSRIFAVTGHDFIVLEKKNRNSNLEREIQIPKVYFTCKNIPVPYGSNAVYLFEKNDFYKVLELCWKSGKIPANSRC